MNPALMLLSLALAAIAPIAAAASPALPTDPIALARTLHARAVAGAKADEFTAAVGRYNEMQRKLAGVEQPFVDKTPEGFMHVEFERMGREWVWLRVLTVTSAFLGSDYPVGGTYSVNTLVVPRVAGREPILFDGVAAPLDAANRFLVRRDYSQDDYSASGQLDLVDPARPDIVLWSADPRVLPTEAVYQSKLSTGPGGTATHSFTQYETLVEGDPRAKGKQCESAPAVIHEVTVNLTCSATACRETSRRTRKSIGCEPIGC
jgi:hypothetical protein